MRNFDFSHFIEKSLAFEKDGITKAGVPFLKPYHYPLMRNCPKIEKGKVYSHAGMINNRASMSEQLKNGAKKQRTIEQSSTHDRHL